MSVSCNNILISCAFCNATGRSDESTEIDKNHSNRQQLKRCIRCKSVAYCNRECQRKHYRVHKHDCRRFAAKSKKSIDEKPVSPFKSRSRNTKHYRKANQDSTQANMKQESSGWFESKKMNSKAKETSMPSPQDSKVITKMSNKFASIAVDDSSDESAGQGENLCESSRQVPMKDECTGFQLEACDFPPLQTETDMLINEGAKSRRKNKKKKKRRKKKDDVDEDDLTHIQTQNEQTSTPLQESKKIDSKELGPSKDACQESKAKSLIDCLYTKLEIKSSSTIADCSLDTCFQLSVDDLIRELFDDDTALWLLIEEDLTSTLFDAILKKSETVSAETKEWLQSQMDLLIRAANTYGRNKDVIAIMSIGGYLSSSNVVAIFEKLSKCRGNSLNNLLAKTLASSCKIRLESKQDFDQIKRTIHVRVGKQSFRAVLGLLKEGKRPIPQKSREKTSTTKESEIRHKQNMVSEDIAQKEKVEEAKKDLPSMFEARIEKALKWYKTALEKEKCKNKIDENEENFHSGQGKQSVKESQELSNLGVENNPCHPKLLSSKEVAEAMAKCIELSEDQQEGMVTQLEEQMDLTDFGLESEWTVDITEEAHKWFRKHIKRQYHFCERVIRRLKLLSTGRWPYVLCKPLKTKKSSVKLYEAKIDSGSRIIWEVAISFSPRRSSVDHAYCEQVIRVWDVVTDHDQLSERIKLTIERIEKSHLRGQQSIIYTELDRPDDISFTSSSNINVPKVFPMRQSIDANKIKCSQIDKNKRIYQPASHDPLQFTLLKFYELNAGAIEVLLDTKDEEVDLPFTPGPREHEIIHHNTNPPRSILLMGRSGTGKLYHIRVDNKNQIITITPHQNFNRHLMHLTKQQLGSGKTTCLVFRMWAQYMAYQGAKGSKPRQLFITKNEVLRTEVERSFGSMGLAWRRQVVATDIDNDNNSKFGQCKSDIDDESVQSQTRFPLFLTSDEWLDIIDRELPGQNFFIKKEIEERAYLRKSKDDTVERGVQAIFTNQSEIQARENIRSEMNYKTFRKLFRKISSRHKTTLDPSMVWKEICTYIKGSISALQLADPQRALPTKRFLSLDQYLSLPRKQSRLNQEQRKIVYSLYLTYEKVKKERNFYDSMDIVYNLAGRISQYQHLSPSASNGGQSLLPFDSLFVDEVQDFTMSELYLLTKLSGDSNNLMLAGDTAQSIAEGVAFRFTDVRQIFFNSFGGVEPDLLQLTHNYRSHSGVLRLAACVVELLYFFFRESLDRLPPDLGLFDGPKPRIMEVTTTEDLVLMLDGSKRETSRIEFGAHQVVIVRNESVKEHLPDEFGVDKDWVMTVQQSKGLEFDDVLIYNFFTDSEAGELWRIVSNYTEDDVAEYYSDKTMTSSGIQNFEWDSIVSDNVRPLEFNHEQHRILETELKMLYTAITRARVNVFFAESNNDKSAPMFNYFKRRRVVDVVNKESSKDIQMSNVAVFGKMSTVEDWRERGKYYLGNADGQRQKGCLRLAAKCFDKAGEEKLRDRALAYLAFVEIEQDSISSKQKTKQSFVQRQQLYDTAAQLLEAEDINFLDKAGLCLLQSGEKERERCAQIFELYARINFCSRSKRKNSAPTPQEQRYFSYAAKLYHQASENKSNKKRQNLIHAIRNFLCSGSIEEWKQASKIIQENLRFLSKAFADLHDLITPSKGMVDDPISYLHQELQVSSQIQFLRDSITKLAKVSCRIFYSQNDQRQFEYSIDALPSTNEKIQILSNLNNDIEALLVQHPWASNQSFSRRYLNNNCEPKNGSQIDVTEKLVEELIGSNEPLKASEALEQRGFLLRAAEIIENYLEKDSLKAIELRIRYIELVLSSRKWKDFVEELKLLVHSLDAICNRSTKSMPEHVTTSLAVLKLRLFKPKIEQFQMDLRLEELSFFWRLRAIEVLTEEGGTMNFLSKYTNNLWDQVDTIVRAIDDTKQACISLRLSRPKNELLFAQIESYFDLEANEFDPSQLKSNLITNLKLCEALHVKKDSFATPTKLVFKTTPQEIYPVLAGYFMQKACILLNEIEKCIEEECTKYKFFKQIEESTAHPTHKTISSSAIDESNIVPGRRCRRPPRRYQESYSSVCAQAESHYSVLNTYTTLIQVRIIFLKKMLELSSDKSFLSIEENAFGPNFNRKINENLRLSIQHLVTCILDNHSPEVKFIQQNEYFEEISSNTILIRSCLLESVSSAYERLCWYKIQLFRKKEDVQELVNFYRVLAFCGDTQSAVHKIDQVLNYLEHHKSMAADWERKKTDHIMRNKVKLVKNKFQSGTLFLRMWVWAVESCKSDIFNSITLVERLIQKSRYMNGKKNTMRKFSQISFLETNTIAIFALLSLRYSEVESGPIPWMIPNRYLHQQVIGNDTTPLRGFGIPLQNVVSATCHKFFLENFFGECVKHLEFIAGTLVKDNFLALSSEATHDSIKEFENAVSLTIFLCCNAVNFTYYGVDMGLEQTQAEVNKRPKLPLHGNFKSLVCALRDALQKLISFNLPCHLREALIPIPKEANFQDLQLLLERYYQLSGIDSISYCSLHQSGVDNIYVDSAISADQFTRSLSDVKFHESDDLFKDLKWKSSSFLKQSEKYDKDISNSNDISTKEIEIFSEESKRRVAATMITRNMRILLERRSGRGRNTFTNGHFRQWKNILRHFFSHAFETLRQKKKEEEKCSIEKEQAKIFPLNQIHNLWNDLGCSQQKRTIWRNVILGRGPICDTLECGFCSLYSGNSQLRREWVCLNYPALALSEGMKLYNHIFNVPQGFIAHNLEQHSTNFNAYHKYVEDLANVASRLDISQMMLRTMIDICEEAQGINPWYSNVAEEIHNTLMSLEEQQRRLWDALINIGVWPLQNNTMTLFHEIQRFSWEPQNVFASQLEKERAMIESINREKENDEE